MKGVDVSRLRELTKTATVQAEEERARAAEQAALEEERKRREEQIKAEGIINQIPGRCGTEARAGRSHAVVMNVEYRYPRDPRQGPEVVGWQHCEPAWLVGASRIVWDACIDAGLSPSLDFWHDGEGVNSGFNIVVHW